MLSILAVGLDAGLLASRCAVLRKTGADVVGGHYHGAQELLCDRTFDVMVLCHTVAQAEARSLVAAVRTKGVTQVVRVLPGGYQAGMVDEVDVDHLIPSDPAALMTKILQLLPRSEREPSGFGSVTA